MKLSMWSEYFHGRELTLPGKIIAFRDCGYEASELSDEDGRRLLDEYATPTLAGKYLARLTDSMGFAFPQGHLWLTASICAPDYRERAELLKGWLDLYLEADIRRAVLHGGSSGNDPDVEIGVIRERRTYVLSQLLDYLKGTELKICLENMPRSDLATSDGLLTVIGEFNSPNLGVTLDTGHLNLTGERQYDFIRACGKHLGALHLADNEGMTDQHLMPFGRGNVDFTAVVRGIREIGYDGLFNYEIPGETQRCPVEVKKMKLRYLKQASEYLLAHA
ncbi:MAG: sugar phosphate isomerase/epimerase [Clostridiales bacterium]|jgi:sugar phosphate isomerase/epimerase|nr:sugar phosphate isomerase/epimerase [Clostridiales bacterium]